MMFGFQDFGFRVKILCYTFTKKDVIWKISVEWPHKSLLYIHQFRIQNCFGIIEVTVEKNVESLSIQIPQDYHFCSIIARDAMQNAQNKKRVKIKPDTFPRQPDIPLRREQRRPAHPTTSFHPCFPRRPPSRKWMHR